MKNRAHEPHKEAIKISSSVLMPHFYFKSEEGFTLVELLIVISIIGILATMMIPSLIGAQKRSYDTGAQSCAKSIQTVQAIHQIDNRSYAPVAAGGITSGTDGVDSSCKQSQMYFNDRSTPANLASEYVVDIWDTRGSKVFTVTPEYLKPNVVGATAFSSTGAGGGQLP